MSNRRPPLHAGQTAAGPQPVEVRLIGEDTAVRAVVAALQQAASCGPASYRPARYGGGIRAYLSIVVPATEDGGQQ